MRSLASGNFNIKICDGGGQPRAIRSVQYRLPRGVNPLKVLKSPLVELPDGTRWHIASQAFKYSSQEQTVNQDKAQLAKLHLYAALEMTEGNIRLIASHHSPDVYADILQSSLAGKHSFKRNGQQVDINVTSVEVVAEGLGSYWGAYQAGLIPESGYTIVIALDGSSWLY